MSKLHLVFGGRVKDPRTLEDFMRTVSGAQAVGAEPVNGKHATASRYYQAGSATALPTQLATGTNGPTTAGVATWTRTFSSSTAACGSGRPARTFAATTRR